MSKRLQVVLSDDEYAEIQAAADRERMTISAWVRRVLRDARAAAGPVRATESEYGAGERGVPLHIDRLPSALHRRLMERARQSHRTVAGEATHLLERALEASEPLSLLELEGLGAALWEGDEAAEHVARERDAWG